MPIVSVITPTRNRDIVIVRRCVGSIQVQTLADFEHLVCSEGDNEAHIESLVSGLHDPRVKYRHANQSVADFGNMPRALMLQEVTGKYVYFFDDDNICFPWFLEKMVNAIESSGADYAVCPMIYYHGSYCEYTRPRIITGETVEVGKIDPVQVVMKREAIQAIGWETKSGYSSDGVTLQRLGERFKGVHLGDFMCVHL